MLDGELPQPVEVVCKQIVIGMPERQVAVREEADRNTRRLRRHLALVPIGVDRKAKRRLGADPADTRWFIAPLRPL